MSEGLEDKDPASVTSEKKLRTLFFRVIKVLLEVIRSLLYDPIDCHCLD